MVGRWRHVLEFRSGRAKLREREMIGQTVQTIIVHPFYSSGCASNRRLPLGESGGVRVKGGGAARSAKREDPAPLTRAGGSAPSRCALGREAARAVGPLEYQRTSDTGCARCRI